MKTPKDWRPRKHEFHNRAEAVPVPIVSDGALRIPGTAGGKMIPMIILDTSKRPDIEEYLRIHHQVGSGDVMSRWGKPRLGKGIHLLLTTLRPVELNILIKFDPFQNTHLINMIVKAEALYLQDGRPGHRVRDFAHAPKLLVSIPDQGFRSTWEHEHHANVVRKFRRAGLSRKEARMAAAKHIAAMSLLEDSTAAPLPPSDETG